MRRMTALVLAAVLVVAMTATPAAAATLGSLRAFTAAPMGMSALAEGAKQGPAGHSGTIGAEDTEGNDDIDVANDLNLNPMTGTLDVATDEIDVYKITLAEGETFWASLDGQAGTDFDLYLYGPDASSVETATPASYNAVSEYPNGLVHEATVAGDYYVVAYSDTWDGGDGGAGTYTIRWATDVGFAGDQSASVVNYQKPAFLLAAFLQDQVAQNPIAGEWIRLYVRRSTGNFAVISSQPALLTDAEGIGMDAEDLPGWVVTPYNKTSYYVSVDQWCGNPEHTESDVPNAFWGPFTVTPRVYISTPYPLSSVKRNTYVSWRGTLKPRHTSGAKTVTLKAEHYESGKWVLRATGAATNKNGATGASTITGRLKLTRTGRWRIYGYAPSDTYHASTKGGYKYLTVK
ncbi:MAG: PPC domain-containing protein [Coriobacteriales bacterium]|nr:PPC domain-containing protein [Coriobacteriales bacterium]